ncbi:DUF7373 family lipoprotein, partial [Nocardia neocaledoniensis]|uniref:DUF7373 family lipoprotein n=1 Tax=Nocardia neocaledoniensis TaxID=236511 RepID=UPI003CC7EF12
MLFSLSAALPTTPPAPADVEAARAPTDGPVLEGLRMAGAAVLPHEVDPALTHDWGTDVVD